MDQKVETEKPGLGLSAKQRELPLKFKHIDRILDGVLPIIAEQIKKLHDRIAALEARPAVKYLGVYDEHTEYPEGSLVSDHGSVWHANAKLEGRPAWRGERILAARRETWPRWQGRKMMRTFEIAAFELCRQSLARGFGGRLDDVVIALCEDHRSIVVYAFFSLDEPLIAGFDLPAAVAEDGFDPLPYIDRLVSPAGQVLH